MNWPTDEFLALALRIADVEFSKGNHPVDTTSDLRWDRPDDELDAQAGGAYLSMDEVRASLDGFEQICQPANLSVNTMLHNRPSVGWAMA